MILRLISLRLRNFKGQRDFFFEPNGKNASVFGDNGTGKTTLMDAFSWLLFDKDSTGKKDFAIKTLDENNEPIHGLEYEVEGVLEVDGKRITLRKVYREVYTKKRGSTQKEFTGHTTDYFVDGVPVKKGEYEAAVANIVDKSIFKLLTNPTYFNEQMDWKKRRELLLEVCGDLTDEQVIASNAKLAKLTEILNGRGVDKHRDTIKAQMRKINEEIDKIPVRISEAQLGMPDIEGIEKDKLPQDVETLQKELQAKQQELARVQSGGEIAEKKKQLAEVEAEILRKQNEANVANNAEVAKKRAELEKATDKGLSISTRIKELKADIEDNARTIQTAEAKAVQLRARWKEENAKQFTIEQDGTCPACGQAIPEEQLAEARQKAEEQFNLEKADKLTEINEEGKSLMESVKATKEENKKTQKQIDKLEAELEESRKEYAVIQQEIEKLQQPKAEDINNPTTAGLIAKKAKLEQEVANLELGSQTEAFKVQEEIDELNDDIKALQAVQAKIEQYDKDTARIAELQAQEKVLATEYERLDGELSLCELFVKTKVEAMEGNINSKFKFARFKMFNQLVNGGIEETAETIYNGVPYSSGLNSGHRTIVGMDIIRTLSEHYGFTAPIWVDNAESVVQLPEMEAQVIRLVVSGGEKKLSVEVE
jgi:DNA repair exonuclease SbcCD ATPase subunit